ncbi:MAG: guanylate kinase [Tissierellales bacterium]|jgi:guanylate kinase|nr:guanylate kinase [Tissierellales bacterium]
MEEGLVIVISGPSGAGKGTICKEIVKRKKDLIISVSATTRSPRKNEIEGKNYYFYTEETFKEKIEKNDFLEYAKVYGNYYGTPKSKVIEEIKKGKNVILEIDIQGALQIKESYPKGIFIFVMPPSMEELKNRITSRGTDSREVILKRMECAYHELNYAFKYDYVIINDDLEEAVKVVDSILIAENHRAVRKKDIIEKIKEE